MNPYYNPAAMGLEIIDAIDDAESYEFHTLLALKDVKTGEVFFCSDSGCSCPTPFDDYDRATMTKITDRQAMNEFKSRVAQWNNPARERDAMIESVEREWRNWTQRKPA